MAGPPLFRKSHYTHTLRHALERNIQNFLKMPKALDTDLMKLTITAFLGSLVTKGRALIPKPLGLIVQQAMFDGRAHHASG